MESGLTYEEIVEILLRQEELLELYRSQLKELTKEYDADDELIELTLGWVLPEEEVTRRD